MLGRIWASFLFILGHNKMEEERKRIVRHYINDPIINRLTAPENKLYRPQINYVRASVNLLFFLSACLAISALFVFLDVRKDWTLRDVFVVYLTVTSVGTFFCMKFIMVWFVRLYQRYANSETRLRCCFTPSCSEYAILAIKKYGAIYGVIKAIHRIRRCKPPGGEDYP